MKLTAKTASMERRFKKLVQKMRKDSNNNVLVRTVSSNEDKERTFDKLPSRQCCLLSNGPVPVAETRALYGMFWKPKSSFKQLDVKSLKVNASNKATSKKKSQPRRCLSWSSGPVPIAELRAAVYGHFLK